MARTKDEIFQDLLTRKNADAILSAILTSSSKASFYYSLFTVLSEFAGDFELTFDDFTETMDALLDSKQVHNDLWWINLCLDFQYGNSLIILDNGNLGYAEEDADANIVQRAAIISDTPGQVTLKIAALDVDGITPIPLTALQKSAFNDYLNDVKPSGIEPTSISVNGDEINIALEVDVSAQIINPDDGTLISDGVTKPVEDAIYNYFSLFQSQGIDNFGGTFFANKLMAQILSAEGVENATFTTLEKKAAIDGGFIDVLALTGKKFATYAGYVRITDGYDLSANITYTGV